MNKVQTLIIIIINEKINVAYSGIYLGDQRLIPAEAYVSCGDREFCVAH